MQIDSTNLSSNMSPRSGDGTIQMIVLHSTEGTRKSDIPILLGHTHRKVSTHYYIQRDGKIFQYVPDNQAAWHAGASSWLGQSAGWIQSHSIGIELENRNTRTIEREDYPDVQYRAALELVKELTRKYRVPSDNLVRHTDIAPGRKADPAFFPWEQFRRDVYSSGNTGSKPVAPVVTPEIPSNPPSSEIYGTADWLNPVDEINTKIETATNAAVSSAISGLWGNLVAGWLRFLDGLRG